ncbi:hypothetical protein Q8A67_023920 [Cirrhinus molitorella]|uniref:Uncharacterized protein n=1 Tax=Cirrhinus molitorella TaxID=172907 RepID=A0AA88P6X0_9TELE|nr:hypothetical protein Q8A67_023920 [Cirrhinus molitorella]
MGFDDAAIFVRSYWLKSTSLDRWAEGRSYRVEEAQRCIFTAIHLEYLRNADTLSTSENKTGTVDRYERCQDRFLILAMLMMNVIEGLQMRVQGWLVGCRVQAR